MCFQQKWASNQSFNHIFTKISQKHVPYAVIDVNIRSGDGLVLSGTKPLPELLLTMITNAPFQH